MAQQQQIKLTDGRALNSIGFGTYLTPPTEACEAVYDALKVGYRLIDTAAVYGNEEQTAEAIAKFLEEDKSVDRKDIIYTSKLWQDDFGENAGQGIAESVENAAQIGKIDLYLMHSPGTGRSERRETWAALEDAVERGEIVSIGVSNWGVKHLKELLEEPDLKIKPLVNQIEINPWFQQNDIVDFCQSQGIAVEAYSPLMTGERLDDPTIQELSRKYKKTPAQVLVNWNIERGTIPLPKSVRADRIKENYEGSGFKLDQEDVHSLGDPNTRFVTVPQWDPVTWD